MRRHPHIATLRTVSKTRDENGDLASVSVNTELKGRFQVASNRGGVVNYDAKFFTSKMDSEAFSLDEAELIFEGKQFKVIQHFNYQTHTELWLV